MSTAVHPDLPLGKDSDYPTTYTPSLLRSIERAQLRATLRIGERLPFQGEDTWNCYEFSWLNAKGRPVVGLVKVRVPCNSGAIVESKSLKLYLNSFAQTVFATRAELLTTLNSDLSLAFRAPVMIDLLDVDQTPEPVVQMPGRSLDDLDVEIEVYHWCPDMLEVEAGAVTVRQTHHTHLFRSVCPVTGQPDWASIMVQYIGHRIPPESLLRYLVSFRNHAAFHEATDRADLHRHRSAMRARAAFRVWALSATRWYRHQPVQIDGRVGIDVDAAGASVRKPRYAA